MVIVHHVTHKIERSLIDSRDLIFLGENFETIKHEDECGRLKRLLPHTSYQTTYFPYEAVCRDALGLTPFRTVAVQPLRHTHTQSVTHSVSHSVTHSLTHKHTHSLSFTPKHTHKTYIHTHTQRDTQYINIYILTYTRTHSLSLTRSRP